MLDTVGEFAAVYAQLTSECPEHPMRDVSQPRGVKPALQDVVTLHVELLSGTEIEGEIVRHHYKGLRFNQQGLDENEDEKAGASRYEIPRSKWGQMALQIWQLPEEHRAALEPTLVMKEARIKGKPEVRHYRDKNPVLRIQLRGVLETGPNGESNDEAKRAPLHSEVWVTLKTVQGELPLDDGEVNAVFIGGVQVELDGTGKPLEDEEKDGDRSMGGRAEALPEYRVGSAKAKMVLNIMEQISSGFIWAAIQHSRRRRGDKRGKGADQVTWTDVEAAASDAGLETEYKEARRQA